MKEIPREIQIGPYKYRVDLSKRALDEAKLKENDTELTGYMDSKKQVILIDIDQGPDGIADTLLHEILHAIVRSSGTYTCEEDDDEDQEEKIIAFLAPYLLDTLRRNPDVVKCLLDNEEEAF